MPGPASPPDPPQWHSSETPEIVIDLTHTVDDQCPFWPGDPPFSLTNEYEGMLDPQTYYYANSFTSGEHVGTHLDAPRHMHRDGLTVESIPLDRLIGPGVCINVSSRVAGRPDDSVTMEDLSAWENRFGPLPSGSIVLLFTGHSRHWPDYATYYGTAETGESGQDELHFPGLTAEAARWLVDQRSVRAVGIDTPGVDPGYSKTFDTHKALFARGVPAFENLANLDRLPSRGFTVIALPMKIRNGSGAPLRIVAVLDAPPVST